MSTDTPGVTKKIGAHIFAGTGTFFESPTHDSGPDKKEAPATLSSDKEQKPLRRRRRRRRQQLVEALADPIRSGLVGSIEQWLYPSHQAWLSLARGGHSSKKDRVPHHKSCLNQAASNKAWAIPTVTAVRKSQRAIPIDATGRSKQRRDAPSHPSHSNH